MVTNKEKKTNEDWNRKCELNKDTAMIIDAKFLEVKSFFQKLTAINLIKYTTYRDFGN